MVGVIREYYVRGACIKVCNSVKYYVRGVKPPPTPLPEFLIILKYREPKAQHNAPAGPFCGSSMSF